MGSYDIYNEISRLVREHGCSKSEALRMHFTSAKGRTVKKRHSDEIRSFKSRAFGTSSLRLRPSSDGKISL